MHECIIGVLWDSDCEQNRSQTVTIEQLKEISNKTFGNNFADFFNPFKRTTLQRFDYCPKCGKKIDWKGLREKQGG